jgi:fucose permease
LAYIVASQHPPYPVLVIIFILAGFGNGLEDAAWNAWVGNMANVNEVLGFLHGFYGLGATISPLIATAMITKANLPWYSYYYLMIGFAAIEMMTSVGAFWKATSEEFRRQNARTTDSKDGRMKEAMLTLPAARVTWIITAFVFLYLGVEVALGGWIVTFMIKVRHGSPFASGMTATGFWLGLTIGRFILGFVTPRIGEKLAVLVGLS